jgi:hypothetical protein
MKRGYLYPISVLPGRCFQLGYGSFLLMSYEINYSLRILNFYIYTDKGIPFIPDHLILMSVDRYYRKARTLQ